MDFDQLEKEQQQAEQQQYVNDVNIMYKTGVVKNTLFVEEERLNNIEQISATCEQANLQHEWHKDFSRSIDPGYFVCLRCSLISQYPIMMLDEWDKQTKTKNKVTNFKYIIYDGYSYFYLTYGALQRSIIPTESEKLYLKDFKLIYKDDKNKIPNWIEIRKQMKLDNMEKCINFIPGGFGIKFPFDKIDCKYYYLELYKNKKPNSRMMSANYIIWRSLYLNKIGFHILHWIPLWYSEKTIQKYNVIFDDKFKKK